MGLAISGSVLVLSVLAAIYGFAQSLFGLRAKARLHQEIARRALEDWHLQALIHKAEQEQMDPAALYEALLAIEKAATSLSENDRKLIEVGLHQPSRMGAQRYVRDILTAA